MWTSYHDWLMTEAIALMSEPGWNEQNEDGSYKYPDLMSRLDSIRSELSTAAQNMGNMPKLDPTTGQIVKDDAGNIVYESWDDRMGSLLSQFEQARIQGEGFTNQQIAGILGGDPTTGQWQPYNPETGTGVMTYPQLAQAVQSGYFQPGADVMGQLWDQRIDPAHAQFKWQNAWGSQYNPNSLANMYSGTRNRVMGYLDQMGQQSAQDISNTFTQARASADQDLSARGLGNTTVRTSTMGGIGAQESAEQRRLQESLAGMKAQYDSALSSEANQARMAFETGGLGAYSDFYNQQNALGSLYGNYMQGLGQNMASLWSQAPNALANIVSAYPSLADIYNLASQAGTGSTGIYALPGFQPGTVVASPTQATS